MVDFRYLLTLLLVVGLLFAEDRSDNLYPHWFLYPSPMGVVGYDGALGATAYEDGVERFYGLQKCTVKGVTKSYLKGNWIDSWQDSVYLEYFSPLQKDSLTLLAHHRIRSGEIVFLAQDTLKVDTSLIDVRTIDTPQWVFTLPHEKGRVYGRGVEKYRYPFVRAWWLSEENAILDIARQEEVKISQLNRSGDSRYEIIRREEFNLNLKNVMVVERWFDVSTRTCFTLVVSLDK